MRTAPKLVLSVGLCIVAVVPAAGDEAKDIIDRAIRAHAGSAVQLAKRKNCVLRSHGAMAFPGAGDAPATREGTFAFPDRIRWSGELTTGATKSPFIITLDGLRGWRMVYGAPQDMTPQEYDVVRDELHFYWVCTLLPLTGSSYTLSALPEIKVNDKPAVGVKVETRGRGAIQLYFDKSDNLLVKGTFRSREVAVEVLKESVFSDYREFEGIKLPTRQVTSINGRKTESWTIDSYRFPAQIDAKVFAKP